MTAQDYSHIYRAVENAVRAIGINVVEKATRGGRVLDFDMPGESGRKWRLWADAGTVSNIRSGWGSAKASEIAREMFGTDFAGLMHRFGDGDRSSRPAPPPVDTTKEAAELREWEARATQAWDAAVNRQRPPGGERPNDLDAWLARKGIDPSGAPDLPVLRLDFDLAQCVREERHMAATMRAIGAGKPPVAAVPLLGPDGMVRAIQYRAIEGDWRMVAGVISNRAGGAPAAYGQPQAIRRARRIVLTEGAADTLCAMALLRAETETIVVGAFNADGMAGWGRALAGVDAEVVVVPHIGDGSNIGLRKAAVAICDIGPRARRIDYEALWADGDQFDLADVIARMRASGLDPVSVRDAFLDAIGSEVKG